MDISKPEQRVLARGGAIVTDRAPVAKVHTVTCCTRDGHVQTDCTRPVYDRLKQ